MNIQGYRFLLQSCQLIQLLQKIISSYITLITWLFPLWTKILAVMSLMSCISAGPNHLPVTLRFLLIGEKSWNLTWAQYYKRFFLFKYRSFPVFTGKKYRLQCYKHILPVFTGRIYRQNLQEDFSCNYRGFPVKQNFIGNRCIFVVKR